MDRSLLRGDRRSKGFENPKVGGRSGVWGALAAIADPRRPAAPRREATRVLDAALRGGDGRIEQLEPGRRDADRLGVTARIG